MTVVITPDQPFQKASDGAFKIYDSDAEEFSIRVRGSLDSDVLSTVVPADERAAPPVKMIALLRCVESRFRAALDLTGPQNEVTIPFSRSQWTGEMVIQIALIRTADREAAVPGFAAGRGAAVAWSGPSRLLFTEPKLPPGEHLPVEWEDFRFSLSMWRREHPADIFAVDLDASPPVIYLNNALPEAYLVLNTAGKTTKRAKARDGINAAIAHQVWTSLIGSAVSDLGAILRDDPGVTPAEALSLLDDWKRRALYDWAPYIFPTVEIEAFTDQWAETARHPEEMSTVFQRLPNAIQKRLGTNSSLLGVVGAL